MAGEEKTVMKCTTCGKRIEAETGWVEFACPKCGKARIVRCGKCRKMENVYACPKCKFEGP